MNRNILIETSQKAIFVSRLKKLNDKAKTFGLSEIKVLSMREGIYERKLKIEGRNHDIIHSSLVPVKPGIEAKEPIILQEISLEFPVVKLGDWQVVGKLDAHESGNLAYALTDGADDNAALQRYAGASICCEHCNMKRKRISSFVLRDGASGQYKEVGSSCLEDFTGIDPAAALFLAKMHDSVRVAEGEFEEFSKSGRSNAVSTRYFLAVVNAITQASGFVSNAKAESGSLAPTWDEALAFILSKDRSAMDLEPHLEHADRIREWFATKDGPGLTSFARNVKLLLGADALAIKRQHLAIAAAAVPSYWREMEGANRSTAPAKPPSRHVGTVGQKMNADLCIERAIPVDSRFGVVDIVLLSDSDGNKLVWKTSALPYSIRQRVMDGEKVDIKASFKVKAHDEYKETMQTSVTHLKILEATD